MSRLVRLRVIASKEDNPWLPEDVVTRPGACIKMSPGHTLAELDPDKFAESEAQGGAQAILTKLRREGLLE